MFQYYHSSYKTTAVDPGLIKKSTLPVVKDANKTEINSQLDEINETPNESSNRLLFKDERHSFGREPYSNTSNMTHY
jgi:hypothetical protein